MRRIFNLLSWILIYGVAIYWGASYFTEQDGTWHMTVIRDTDFTPSHIIEFYMSYPMYIVVGVGGFMYARTRLPTFACKGWSVAYVLLFVGPFMIFPNVGLNEWGHTSGSWRNCLLLRCTGCSCSSVGSRLRSSALRCRFLAVSKNLRTAMKICSVSSRLNKLSARVEDPWV